MSVAAAPAAKLSDCFPCARGIGLAGDDQRLQLALAERRHRAERGFDAIGCAADADSDVVLPDARLADHVESRDDAVSRRELHPAVSKAIAVAAQPDAAIVDDSDPSRQRGRFDRAGEPEVWEQLDGADAVVHEDRIGDRKADLEDRARQPGRQRRLARAAGCLRKRVDELQDPRHRLGVFVRGDLHFPLQLRGRARLLPDQIGAELAVQAARHIEQDVAGDDRQTAAGASGFERQLTVDADAAAVDRAPKLRQRQTLVCEPKLAGPAGEQDALSRYQPRGVAERRLRADLPGAPMSLELEVPLEPAGRAARHERADEPELGVDIETDVALDALHEADAAAARHLGVRATPVETLDGERAFCQPKTRDLGLSVRQLVQRNLGTFEPEAAGDGRQLRPRRRQRRSEFAGAAQAFDRCASEQIEQRWQIERCLPFQRGRRVHVRRRDAPAGRQPLVQPDQRNSARSPELAAERGSGNLANLRTLSCEVDRHARVLRQRLVAERKLR